MNQVQHTEHIHDSHEASSAGIIWAVFFAIILFMIIVFGFQALRGTTQNPTVNIPDKVDVNLNNPQ